MAEEIKKVNYTKEELAHRNKLIKKLCDMRDDREESHAELNGMSVSQYYDSNRKKDLSYIPPKKNKHDTRIVTGTTREKDSTLLSSLLNLNAEATVTAFDHEDTIINELGTNIADLVHKSRELEDWNKKRPLIYRELVSQGDVYIEELYVEEFREVPLEELKWNPTKDKVSELSFAKKLKKVYAGCEARMVAGNMVYEGSMKTEYIEDQARVALVRVMGYDEAQEVYGQWDRWENVPKTVTTVGHTESTGGTTYTDWSMIKATNQVVEIRYYDKVNNRFMIMLNGVMMLPINYPLSAISPSGEIPITQGKLEPINGFSRSKSSPSKVAVDQAVIDEVLTLMIKKTRQSFKPPMGNVSKKKYSSDIFEAGKITNEINKNTVFPLLPQLSGGVTPPEFSFYNAIKQNINEKTVNDVYAGNEPTGNPTATEILALRDQQALKLGMALDAVVNMEKRMVWLRIYNIMSNWTRPIDTKVDKLRDELVDVYRTVTANTVLDDGNKGKRVFKFTNSSQMPSLYEQLEEEKQLSKKYGNNTRIVYLDPDKLRTLKATFFIVINPTPQNNDKLSQLMFVNNLRTAMELFGVEAINESYARQRYAIVIGEDSNKLFKEDDMIEMLREQMQGGSQPQGQPQPAMQGAGMTPQETMAEPKIAVE